MKKTRFIALTGITAAVYMAATLAIAPMGFEAVQFRISEVLTLLAWVNPSFVPGLVLGCAMANLFSPLGIFDLVFGTFHTLCSTMLMTKTKNMYLASLWPTILSFIIGLELYIVERAPFVASTVSVMLGEFICISLIGCVIFTFIRKNEHIMSELQKY